MEIIEIRLLIERELENNKSNIIDYPEELYISNGSSRYDIIKDPIIEIFQFKNIRYGLYQEYSPAKFPHIYIINLENGKIRFIYNSCKGGFSKFTIDESTGIITGIKGDNYDEFDLEEWIV